MSNEREDKTYERENKREKIRKRRREKREKYPRIKKYIGKKKEKSI